MKTIEQFINEQDPNQAIRHFSWHSCAIGNYADAINIDHRADRCDYLQPEDWSSEMFVCVDALKAYELPNADRCFLSRDDHEDKNSLYDALNVGHYEGPDEYNIDTYGGLQQLLKDCINHNE
jgi:hypothetical protein